MLQVLREALDESGVKPEDIDVVCYTKGDLFYDSSDFLPVSIEN